MTIQEAQEMIKTIPDYCMWDVKFNDAEEVIRQAIKNGYQLCKVDEVVEKIDKKISLEINSIATRTAFRVCKEIIKEGCE